MKTLNDIEKGIMEEFNGLARFTHEEGFDRDRWYLFLKSALAQQREKIVGEMEKLSEFRYADKNRKDVILWMHVRGLINKLENHENR